MAFGISEIVRWGLGRLTGAQLAASATGVPAMTAAGVMLDGRGAPITGPVYTSFAQTVPLNGLFVMPPQTIGSALAFTPAASPAIFGRCYVRLLANGTNAPDFSSFTHHGSSSGWDNTSGILNYVDFWYDGVTEFYAVNQDVDAAPVVIPSVSAAEISASTPTVVTLTFSSSMSAASVPAASAFVISNSGGADTVTNVAISGATVTLTKSRSTLSADVVTLAYTTPGSNPLVSSAGVAAASFSGRAVNNGLATQAIRLSTLTSYTESGSAGAGYSYTATSNSLSALASNADKGLTGDGYIYAKIAGSVTGTSLFFLDDANDATTYTGNVFGAQLNGNGSPYLIAASGAANGAANGTATNAAINDIIRLRRAGSIGYVEISKDAGATWILLNTRTGITTATLYPKCNGGPTGAVFGPIFGFGVA